MTIEDLQSISKKLKGVIEDIKWVHVDDIKRLSKKQWEQAIKTSYELIGSKLPVKLKKEFGLK